MARLIATRRSVWVAAVGLMPALAAVAWPGLAWLCLGLDVALLVLVLLDGWRAPGAEVLRVHREVAQVLSSNVVQPVRLQLEAAPDAPGVLRGELRDTVPPGPEVQGHRQAFVLEGRLALEYQLKPLTRGDLAFGDLWVRLEGPLGLGAREVRFPLAQTVRVFPDLTALSKDAVALARAEDAPSKRVLQVRGEGREFESLREYRPGDDRRALDWKATARRGKAMVRQHQPERNQVVLLMIDCGRHMTGEVNGRRKLDHAVDAALRLARVSLDQGDQVGVVAFAAGVQSMLPPGKGPQQLHAITQALYRVEATMEESDYGAAMDRAFSRYVRRSLVLVLTDLLDADAAQALTARVARLKPRHLPVVVSLRDEELELLATREPSTRGQALERFVAGRLEDDARHTVARLRGVGARVVRTAPRLLGPATVSEYLEIKSRGLL
jgi:uncharacterized protein (DUF58 family)